MGARHPDRIPDQEWQAAYPSVERMIVGKWEIIGRCELCELQLHVSLTLLARLSGPKYSVWGTTRACPRLGCTGRIYLRGKPPQRGTWFDLSRTRE